MIQSRSLVPILLAAACWGCAYAPSGKDQASLPLPTHHISVQLGTRGAKADNSSSFDSGALVGGEYCHFLRDDLGIEAGISRSKHHEFFSFGLSEDLTVVELYGGGQYAFSRGTVSPYVGAGLSLLFLDGRDADDGAGIYGHTGLKVKLSRRLSMGVDVRGLVGTPDELARYIQLVLTLGWSF